MGRESPRRGGVGPADEAHRGRGVEGEVQYPTAGRRDDAAEAALRERGDLQGIDVNIVPSEGRRKQLLIADMDSTIITSESLDDMARLR